MVITNNCRRGWALRYLREAKAELSAAQGSLHMAPRLLCKAVKKAQAAIYYSLGEPPFIENIVLQSMRKEKIAADPFLRCLVGIERTVQQVMHAPKADTPTAIKQVDALLQRTSDIVELFTGEKEAD